MRASVFALLALASLICGSLGTPAGYTRAPGGKYVHRSCAHRVMEGDVVTEAEDGTLTVSNPLRAEPWVVPECRFPAIPAFSKNGVAPPSGWQVFAYDSLLQTDGEQWYGFNGTWNVPDAPAKYTGQTLFTFTAFQNNCGGVSCGQDIIADSKYDGPTTIFQPVLQYGPSSAGGAAYWALANWFVTSSGTALYSNLVTVNAGDEIFGTMAHLANTTWLCTIHDNTADLSANNLGVDSKQIPYEKVAMVTLEVYSVKTCEEYPTTPITYTGLSLHESGGTNPVPDWSPVFNSHACTESVVVNNATSITINF